MKQFGIIGYPLSHSFSPAYFTNKFAKANIEAAYNAYPLQTIEELPHLVAKHSFAGLNVTLPFKEKVIPYLDELDSAASLIGAVNTIQFVEGRMIGYNTDYIGFMESLQAMISGNYGLKALVFGYGGAAKAVCYALQQMHIEYAVVSRKEGFVGYSDLLEESYQDYRLWINTTSIGMSPKVHERLPLPYDRLDEKYFLYDLIYNPEKTIFLTEGLARGSQVKNGYDMLLRQAEAAWKIWNTND